MENSTGGQARPSYAGRRGPSSRTRVGRGGTAVDMRYDGGETIGAAARLAKDADTGRRLSVAAGRLGRGIDEGPVLESLLMLGDVCGDVLEVCGLDLDLLGTMVRAGVRTYDEVERSIAREARRAAW